MRHLLFALPLLFCGCMTPSQTQTPTTVAASAVTAAKAIDPVAVAKVAAACPAVLNGLAAVKVAATLAKASSASLARISGDQAVATGSCTAAGQKQLASNDAQPITATNSGDSATFLNTVLTDGEEAAQIAEAVAPFVIPLL